MGRKIPVYQAKVTGEKDGVFAMSFVDFPAIERNFVALKKKQPVKLSLDKQKQILTGPVLVPDFLIYRNHPEMGEYYLQFTAEEIEKISQQMMRTGLGLHNTTHQHETELDGNYLTELWIVADSEADKSAALGLGKFPKGTLMASYKIEDRNYWVKEVLSGNVKGFSLEGFFNLNNVTMNMNRKKAGRPAKKGGAVASFLKSMAAMLEGETVTEVEDLLDVADDDLTDSGTPFLVFELAEGGELLVDEDGYATINDEIAPAGEHALADGNFIVIDDSGMMVVTTPEPDSTEEAAAELAAAKRRGRAYLSKAGSPAARIKRLEAEIAKLKRHPSASKAKPRTHTNLSADAPFTDRVAAALSARLERKSR